MYEVYKAIHSRKTYLVFEPGTKGTDMKKLANYHYKTKPENIVIQRAWLFNGELYLEDPHRKKSKLRWIAYLK